MTGPSATSRTNAPLWARMVHEATCDYRAWTESDCTCASGRLLDAALSEERRLTVERIAKAVGGPPDSHCASDCCDAYPRLHLHGDHDEWNAMLAEVDR